jgi:T5SS/PEP-CTERM-associated repeat protein/autotransporter-associated beta strand protein
VAYVDGGSVLTDYACSVGTNSGVNGSVTVTGAGSKWTTGSNLVIAHNGSAVVNIQAGGLVSDKTAYVCDGSGSTGTVTVSGSGSKWTAGTLYLGHSGNASLSVDTGGQVSSGNTFLGYNPGSTGTATVTGSGSSWTSGDLYVGSSGGGTLTVTDGAAVTVNYAIFASMTSLLGNGTVSAKGAVLDANLVFDAAHGLQQTYAFGNGGALIVTQTSGASLGAGYKSNGTLRVADGKSIASSYGYLGYNPGSTGIATVTGSSSKWTTGRFYVGYSGYGSLNVEAAGQVSSGDCDIGHNPGSSGTVTVTGSASKWTPYNLYVGYSGNGELNIDAGAQVSDYNLYVGYNSGSAGIVTVTGNGSTLLASYALFVGYSASGTLNIGGGSSGNVLVTAPSMTLGTQAGGTGTCNIDNNGTLRVSSLRQGGGLSNFNWIDGTIQNCNAHDLKVYSGLVLKLAATGTHAFNIDSGQAGTVDAILTDATANGTLNKTGSGFLSLTQADTYTGQTTVEAGRLKVTGSILNSSGVTVNVSATLELACGTGSATADDLPLSNAGTLVISAPSQTLGTITGPGVTQVNSGASLTAQSISQRSLLIGTTAAQAAMADASPVPEPGTAIMLALGLAAFAPFVRSRAKPDQT